VPGKPGVRGHDNQGAPGATNLDPPQPVTTVLNPLDSDPQVMALSCGNQHGHMAAGGTGALPGIMISTPQFFRGAGDDQQTLVARGVVELKGIQS
jgi:hypothetical protein